MDYTLRFTLNNDTSGSLVIEEPDGWKDAMLKLERSEEFHSVIEHYDETFTFFEESYEYIKNVRDTQGFDADVTLTVEISEGGSYETVFSGLLDIGASVEMDFYKIECPIVRSDIWSRFINNRSTSIDIQSTTDLYGENKIVLSPITLNLPPQPIRTFYVAENDEDITYDLSINNYGIIDFANPIAATLERKFNYPRSNSPTVPFELFHLKWTGLHDINCTIYLSTGLGPSGQGDNYTSATTDVYFQLNEDTPVAFTKTNQGIAGVNGRTFYEYDSTTTLNAGDVLRFYIQGNSTVIWLDYYTSQLFVQADTEYAQTTASAFMIHEAFQSVIDRIVGQNNSLYSEYIGNEDTQQTNYASNGCGSLCAVLQGVHLKQFSLTSKPLSFSFDHLWNGHNPIFNLGLGYATIDNREVIQIEDKAYFYDSDTSINLDYVNNIEVSLDTEKIYKNIKIGYQKWEGESESGLDDPQTKHEYAIQLKKSGRDLTLESEFIAASYAIENTRRKFLEQDKDWKLDNDTFIIVIDKDIIGSPALVYEPELGGFSSVTDLENQADRYNKNITPARNFLRWRNVFNSGLQVYTDYEYQFVKGEGNVLMTSVSTATCQTGTVTENQNFDVTADALHDNVVYSFNHPLSWTDYKTIRNNRHKAIGVSQTNSGHNPFFIKNLEYNIHDAIGRFSLVRAIIPDVFTIEINLDDSVTAGMTWNYLFSGSETISLDLTGVDGGPSTSSNTSQIDGIGSVVVNLTKTFGNSGNVETDTEIEYYVNDVIVHTDTILSGQSGINEYTFTGLNNGDEIRVDVNE